MSDGECTGCGVVSGVHAVDCPRVAVTLPRPTAYDRAQAELERKLDAAFASVKRKSDRIERLEERVDAALRRIEQLERDVALDRGEAIKSEKRIEALELEVAMSPRRQASAAERTPRVDEFTDNIYTAFVALDCIKQCNDLKFQWASLLSKYDVALWMYRNPDKCRGAFDLSVLEQSIDPEVRAEYESGKRQPVDANGSPLPDEGT